MSVQICEGIWRNRSGQRLVITQCKPDDDGQRWTDGDQRYSDNGSFYGRYGGCSEQDLVEYIGPFPYSRPAETESTTAVAGGVSEDPGRIIYDLEERLKTANATIDRLRTELEQSQGVRRSLAAEIERLQAELRGYAAETHRQLRTLQQSHDSATATLRAEHRGAQAAYLAAIKAFLEASR